MELRYVTKEQVLKLIKGMPGYLRDLVKYPSDDGIIISNRSSNKAKMIELYDENSSNYAQWGLYDVKENKISVYAWNPFEFLIVKVDLFEDRFEFQPVKGYEKLVDAGAIEKYKKLLNRILDQQNLNY